MRSAILVAMLVAVPASAQSDPRLRTIAYLPGAVFTLRVVPGYVATVIFNPDERIESVAVGNSAAWDVTPSKSGDHLFVKPLAAGITTNVEVVTDSRHYSFILQSTVDGDSDAALRVGFDYTAAGMMPAPEPTPPVAPVTLRPATGYRLAGDALARPLAVSEDGTSTLFEFARSATLPAIYALNDHGQEMLITTRRTERGWTVDRVWDRYVLRLGKATARARRLAPERPR